MHSAGRSLVLTMFVAGCRLRVRVTAAASACLSPSDKIGEMLKLPDQRRGCRDLQADLVKDRLDLHANEHLILRQEAAGMAG